MSGDDLRFHQTTFLQMQKDIFYDASTMHETHLDGGMQSIAELATAGLLGNTVTQRRTVDRAVRAWSTIDAGIRTGDIDALRTGNEGLLRREQYYAIGQQYRNMRTHPVTGEAVTYLMGLVGQPSIPGARTLGQVDDPLHIEFDVNPLASGVQGEQVTINIPRSKIADFDTRWALIKGDTLPSFNRLVYSDPERVKTLLNEPFRNRTNDMRLSQRLPKIVGGLVEEACTW